MSIKSSSLRTLALLIVLLVTIVRAQVEQQKIPPRKEDIKFIKCEVCQFLAQHAYDQAQKLASVSDTKVFFC